MFFNIELGDAGVQTYKGGTGFLPPIIGPYFNNIFPKTTPKYEKLPGFAGSTRPEPLKKSK